MLLTKSKGNPLKIGALHQPAGEGGVFFRGQGTSRWLAVPVQTLKLPGFARHWWSAMGDAQVSMHTNDGVEPILQSTFWGLFMRCDHPHGACTLCKAGRWPLIRALPSWPESRLSNRPGGGWTTAGLHDADASRLKGLLP